MNSLFRNGVFIAFLMALSLGSQAAVLNDGTTAGNLTRLGNVNGTAGVTSTVVPGTNGVLEASQSADTAIFAARATWFARDRFPTSGVYSVSAEFVPVTAESQKRGGVMGWINLASTTGIALQVRPAGTTAGFQLSVVNFEGQDSEQNDNVGGLFDLTGTPATADIASAWSELPAGYDPAQVATFQLDFKAPSTEELALVTNATAKVTAKVFQGTESPAGPPVQIGRTIELLTTLPVPAAAQHRVGYYAYWGSIRDPGAVIGYLDNLSLEGASGTVTNRPPVVALLSPSNRTELTPPADIEISATASDTDGQVVRVDIYINGTNKVATLTEAPYLGILTSVPSGRYAFTAVALDDSGASTTSSPPAVVTVNNPPVAEILVPRDGQLFASRASIDFVISAVDDDGIATIKLFNETTLIGSLTNTVATNTVFQLTWPSVFSGNYTNIYALVTDNQGSTNYTSRIEIAVLRNAAPFASLTNPPSGGIYGPAGVIPLGVEAVDPDGTIIKVEYYASGSLIGTSTNAPFNMIANGVPPGTHLLMATVFDSGGGRADTTNVVSIVVRTNVLPTITLTSPTNGVSFDLPATVLLSATAADSDGSIARVQFLLGTNLVGTLTNSPYQLTLTNLVAGNYVASAVAYDNLGGFSVSTSAAFSVREIQIPTAPPVTLSRVGDLFKVTWPAAFIGYTLQISGAVGNADWRDISGSSTTNVAFVQVSGVEIVFFRLIKREGSTTPPSLTIALQGDKTIVAWPSTVTDYRLQSSTNVAALVWSDVPAPGNRLTNTVETGSYRFYRLIK